MPRLDKLLLAVISIVVFLLCVSPRAEADDAPKVLVLHSYHQGFEWTDLIHKGFSDTLSASFPKAEVFVEYMNTKRQTLETMSTPLYGLYKKAFSNVAFDVIVASDNNALDFGSVRIGC